MMISRVPAIPWLKRLVLPGYNRAHHAARASARLLDAIRHRRFERCACCGRVAAMIYHPEMIPDRLAALWGLSPRVRRALARKESLYCARCGAKLRARRLAATILDLYPTAEPAESLAAWSTRPEARRLRVAEFNRIDGLHEAIAALPGLEYSEFRAGAVPGSIVEGVRAEDLTRLTYPDSCFDLVLTSETLEHIPDLARGLAEIARVLAPGGRHLFTVPVLPGVEATYPRAVVEPDGSIRHHAAAIAHPGGDVGYPVFTEFGADLPRIVAAAGFEVDVRYGPTTEDDLAQVYVARKPEPEAGSC